MADDLVDQLRAAAWRASVEYAHLMITAADRIERLQAAGADLLEWADHQSCGIDDDLSCDCGYDALHDQWHGALRNHSDGGTDMQQGVA